MVKKAREGIFRLGGFSWRSKAFVLSLEARSLEQDRLKKAFVSTGVSAFRRLRMLFLIGLRKTAGAAVLCDAESHKDEYALSGRRPSQQLGPKAIAKQKNPGAYAPGQNV